MREPRIKSLNVFPGDIIVALADGNPGAVRVMMEMFAKTEAIDPDNAIGGLGSVLFLETLGMYGSRIWLLYKDVCDMDLVATLGMLRAVQLGLLSERDLLAAIDGDLRLDTAMHLALVRAKLPDFGAAGVLQ
jgi:hypothetical protein